MSRKQTVLFVTLFSLACLAIGVIWTVRVAPPSLHPWWGGKDARVRVEVWEPGKDLATLGMTFKKQTLDAMIAFGMSPTVDVEDGKRFRLKKVWRELQTLPPQQRLVRHENGATMYLWIETDDIKPPPLTPELVAADSGTGGTF
jgi:hypothetical protein